MTTFTCDTKEFAAALAIAGRVVPQKSPWPIYTNVKIVTNDNRVTIVGSNGDTTYEAHVPANVETEGVICVPFSVLADFAKRAKADTVKLSEEPAGVRVSAGRSRITLGTVNADDFPNFRPPEGNPVSVDGPTFCAALRFAAAASEESETRWTMAGPHFMEETGLVSVWGTDGKSIHHAEIIDLDGIGGGGTIPLPAAQVILSVSEKADDVSFMVCKTGWHLATKDVRVWGKVIDGGFPDVKRVMAMFGDWRDVADMAKADLTNAIGVATCGAEAGSDKSRNIILRAINGDPMTLRGQKAIGGVMHAGRAETDATAKGEFAGALNVKYLSAALTGISGDDVSVCVSEREDGTSAVQIKPAHSSATLNLAAMFMTLRVSDAELVDV